MEWHRGSNCERHQGIAAACELGTARDQHFRSKAPTTDEWDRFVAEVPWASPQHKAAWGEALAASFGFIKPEYRLFYLAGRPIAGIPLMHVAVGGLLHSTHSSAFDSAGGPLIVKDHLENDALYDAIFTAIDAHASEHGSFEARIMLPATAPSALTRRFAKRQAGHALARNCPLLDLGRDIDTITAGYASPVRRAVRKAGREGIEVVDAADLALAEQAFPIYQDTMRRIGGSTKPWRFLKMLIGSGLAVPFVARLDGKPVGLVILLRTPQIAIYWISASDALQSNLRPTNALVDHAIKWSHAQGMRTFSFGETPGERSTLERFKMGWGSEVAASWSWARTYRPLIKFGWERLEPLARQAYGMLEGTKRKNAAAELNAQA